MDAKEVLAARFPQPDFRGVCWWERDISTGMGWVAWARFPSAVLGPVSEWATTRSRTIPVPDWVHGLLNEWTEAAGVDAGKLFRRVSSAGRAWGDAVTEKLV